VISKLGRQNIARVAADSNVILSAIIGKSALRVFTESSIQVVTVKNVLDEVQEYLPVLASRYRMAPEVLEGQLQMLGIKSYSRSTHRSAMDEAQRRIGGRDADDVELLALALALKIPVWSNDKDFENCGVPCYTTAELVKWLTRSTGSV
jgi:predicted nucleic acid-binding protein